ncbi:MAG: hypothetical protein LBE13_03170 [Bacteroidales bacterium]|nr:hypothetical protein [Bacteroidales bacterium]
MVKQNGSKTSWESTIRPSMGVGLTWRDRIECDKQPRVVATDSDDRADEERGGGVEFETEPGSE